MTRRQQPQAAVQAVPAAWAECTKLTRGLALDSCVRIAQRSRVYAIAQPLDGLCGRIATDSFPASPISQSKGRAISIGPPFLFHRSRFQIIRGCKLLSS